MHEPNTVPFAKQRLSGILTCAAIRLGPIELGESSIPRCVNSVYSHELHRSITEIFAQAELISSYLFPKLHSRTFRSSRVRKCRYLIGTHTVGVISEWQYARQSIFWCLQCGRMHHRSWASMDAMSRGPKASYHTTILDSQRGSTSPAQQLMQTGISLCFPQKQVVENRDMNFQNGRYRAP